MANKIIAATIQFNGINEAANSIAALTKELNALKAEQAKSDPTSARYKELAELVALYTSELKLLQEEQKKVNQSFQEVALAAGSYASIQEETKRLTDQFKQLAVGVNATQEEYDALKVQIRDNNTLLAQMNAELKAVNKSQEDAIGGVSNSIFALKNDLKALREEQSKTDSTSDEYKRLAQQIATTASEIKALEDEQKRVNAAFEESKLAAGSYAQLTAETKRLTAELKGMSIGVNATREEFDAVLARIKANNEAITDLNREMRNSKSIAERFREGAVAAFKDVALSIVAGVSALEGFNALKGIGELGLSIEQGFAQVNTVAQLSDEALAQLQSQVLETAKTSTANLEEVPGALFKILSATGDVDESQKILAASLRAAKVGFTDIGSAADAGSQIFGAVKDQVKDVNEVFDVLFRTQKEGVLTFADLAKEIPRVIPSANQAGFAFKEVSGALATITKAGLDANQSATVLDAAFREIADPAKQKGFKQIGASIFDAAGQTRPLVDVIGDLDKAFAGLNPEEKAAKLKQIGLSGEASKGIGILVDNITTLGVVTDSVVNGSLGEFDRQFEKSANTLDDLKIATNELQVTLIQELQPAFVGIGRTLISLIGGFAKLIGFLFENKGIVFLLASAYAALNIAKINSLAIAAREQVVQGALLVIDKASLLFTTLRTAATTAYGIAQQVLTGRLTLAAAAQEILNFVMAANPVGALVAGTLALIGALTIYESLANKVTAAEKERARVSEEINNAVKATNEAIGKETAQLELLVRGIRDETRSKEEKKLITDQLLSQYGKYLSELDKEAVKAGEVEVAYRKIKQAITENIIARQKSEATEKLFGDQIAKQRDAALELGKEFGKTANEVLTLVEDFQKLPAAAQDLAARGKISEALGIQQAGKDLSDTQKKSIEFFDQIQKRSAEYRKTGFTVVDEEVSRIDVLGSSTDKLLTPVEARLKRIVVVNKALTDGLVELDAKFGQIGTSGGGTFTTVSEGANAAAQSIAQLEAELALLQKTQKETATNSDQWKAQEVEINRVKAAIERISGASKGTQAAAKKSTEETKKNAEAEIEAAERRGNALLELRRQLSDALLANQDDETERLLQAESDRYIKEFQLATDNADKIILAKGATQSEIEDAQRTSDALLEQIQIKHYANLNDIAAEGLKKELETQAKADAEAAAQRQRVNGLQLATVEQEIQNEEKNFKRRRVLIETQNRLRLQQLELETMAALKEAKTDEERTAIMENEAANRIGILKETATKIQDEKAKQGPLLARLLGVTPNELQKLGEIFNGFTQVLNQALDQFFESRLKSFDQLIASAQERIDLLGEASQQQAEKLAALEERLTTATGERRQRLIALIEAEKQRQQALFDQTISQEKVKAKIEADKAALEEKQAKIRKAQAIAQAIANTAVGITRTIAEVPKVDFGVSTAILIGLYAALGAAQVALISAQKFAKGGKVEGPSHDNGGVTMAVPSQGRFVELEGNEMVVNKRATANNEGILHQINTDGHRTRYSLVADDQQFADGGIIAPNFEAINGAFEASGTNANEQINRTNELLAALVAKRSEVAVVDIIRGISNVQTTQQRARS